MARRRIGSKAKARKYGPLGKLPGMSPPEFRVPLTKQAKSPRIVSGGAPGLGKRS